MVSLSLSPSVLDRISKRKVLASCLWMPFEFAIICTIAHVCNAFVWAAVAFNSVEGPYFRGFLAKLTLGVMHGIPVILGGVAVDFLVYYVFANVPLFNGKKRPHYSFRQRVTYHADFLKNVTLMVVLLQNVEQPTGFVPLVNVTSFSDFDPFGGDSPFDSIMAFAWFYLVTACAVQSGLLLCDILYFSGHILQHKFKAFYEISNHDYHHVFRFPLSACGPWLAPADLGVSFLTTFVLPATLTLHLMSYQFKVFEHLPPHIHEHRVCFYRVLIYAYIHWLNDHDHCGKQMPLWSGAPLFPPLGWALGLDQCIPNHESHHNFHTCGYGLLSVADRLFGTNGYPCTDPRFPDKAISMGKAAAAVLAQEKKNEKNDENSGVNVQKIE